MRDIFEEMRQMQTEMERMFEMLEPRQLNSQKMLAKPENSLDYRKPMADIEETDKEILAAIELPGVKKEDIRVNVSEQGVEIKVEKKNEQRKEDKNKGYYSYSRSYSGFYRYFSLPEYADPSRIEAKFENGLLELKIPKKEISKAKQIEVK